MPVLLWESGELTQQAPQAVTPRTLVIAISQSGESGEVKRLTELPARPGHAVTITNGPDNALARAFRDHAGRVNQRIAAAADRVVMMVAGLPMTVKGEEPDLPS